MIEIDVRQVIEVRSVLFIELENDVPSTRGKIPLIYLIHGLL